MTKVITNKRLSVSYIYQERLEGYVQTPAIRLNGKWLEKLGFGYKKKVNIQLRNRKLVITLLEEKNIAIKKIDKSKDKL